MNATNNTQTKLENEVSRIVRRHSRDYEGENQPARIAEFMNDLNYGGCESGLVGELIYYHDTLPFYRRHQSEINALLVDTMQEIGATSPADIFGQKWDSDDPLALDTLNQNLLAWFAFEETARRLYPKE
jgi:hypothetical protein